MLRIRVFKVSSDILSTSIAAQKRFYSRSASLCKKYKYALDPKRATSRGSGLSQYRHKRRGLNIVEGKALAYFSFDTADEEASAVESPKQIIYADIVHFAVTSLLNAREAPKEIQDCSIQIVHVEVATCLNAATVIWRLLDYVDSKYTKEETSDILNKHLTELRLMLPAYSTVTQTPRVTFVYDIFSEKEKEIDELFDIAKKQEKEYMKTLLPSAPSETRSSVKSRKVSNISDWY